MAENKKAVLIYTDLKKTVDLLSNEEAGLFFKHFLSYINDENPEPLPGLLAAVFEPHKQQLKRDLRKYETKRSGQSKSGAEGNLKRWHPDLYLDYCNNKITLEEALKKVANYRKVSPPDKTESGTIAKIAVTDTVKVTVTDTANVKEKDISKENKKSSVEFSPEVENAFSLILNQFPSDLRPKDNVKAIIWKHEIDKLNRIDGLEFEEIMRIVKWARDEPFWTQQFLSLTKLRKISKSHDLKFYKVFQKQMEKSKPSVSLLSRDQVILKTEYEGRWFQFYKKVQHSGSEIKYAHVDDIKSNNLTTI